MAMKMTMHIDEALLERVKLAFGCSSKTEAVEMALKEMDRKNRFRAMVSKPGPFTAAELREAVDPAYDIPGMRKGDFSGSYKVSRARKRSG